MADVHVGVGDDLKCAIDPTKGKAKVRLTFPDGSVTPIGAGGKLETGTPGVYLVSTRRKTFKHFDFSMTNGGNEVYSALDCTSLDMTYEVP